MPALLVATEPFWVVILSWLWLKASRPTWKVAVGLVIGFLGVWLLISGNGTDGSVPGGTGRWIGVLAVLGRRSIVGDGIDLRPARARSQIVDTYGRNADDVRQCRIAPGRFGNRRMVAI